MGDSPVNRFVWKPTDIIIQKKIGEQQAKATTPHAAPATVPHVEEVTMSDVVRWNAMYDDIENEVKRGKS